MNPMDKRDNKPGMDSSLPPKGAQMPYNPPPSYPPPPYPPCGYPPNAPYDYYGGAGYYPSGPYYPPNSYGGSQFDRPPESNWDQHRATDKRSNWDRDTRYSNWDHKSSADYRESRRSNWDSRTDRYRDNHRSRSRSRSHGRPADQPLYAIAFRLTRREDSDRIFISGLDPHVTEQIIREHFLPYGRVKNVKLPVDHKTGRQRDIALVTMDSAESVNRALREASHTIMGKEVKQLCVSMFGSR